MPDTSLFTPGKDNLLEFDYNIIGTTNDDLIVTRSGDDTVYGSLGNDTLDGGAHSQDGGDTLTYEDLQGAEVTVEILTAGDGQQPTVFETTKNFGPGLTEKDNFQNFEKLTGTDGADLLKFKALPSDINGMEFDGGDNQTERSFTIEHYVNANNTVTTMLADADVLSLEGMGGAAGQPGVSVVLDNPDTEDPADGYLSFGTTTVSILNFEHVLGTDGNDAFFGSDVRNVFFGFTGDDILVGRGGEDLLVGDGGADTLYGGTWIDDATEEPDPLNYVDDGFTDILYGGLGNDNYYVSHEDLIFDMTLEQAGVPISDGQGGLTLRSMNSSAPAPVAQPAPLGKTETQSLAQVG